MEANIPFRRVKDDILNICATEPKVFTLDQQKPNWIVDADQIGVHIRTTRSQDKAAILKWAWFEKTWAMLLEKRALPAKDFPGTARFRSSGIAAILARLPYVGYKTKPLVLFLTSQKPPPPTVQEMATKVPPNASVQSKFKTDWLNIATSASLAIWKFDPKFPICLLRPPLERMVRKLVEQFSVRDQNLDLCELIRRLRYKVNADDRRYIDDMHFLRVTANAALHWPTMKNITYDDAKCAIECFVKIATWWEKKVT